MASRTALLVAVAAAAGVLATTAATRAGSGGTAAATFGVPTGTARVITTTLTSRQQVNGTLGYPSPVTLVAPQGSTPQQVAQARAAANSAAVALQNARTAQSHSSAAGQQAADQAQAAVDSAQAQSYGAWTSLQATLTSEAVPPGILTWLPTVGATVSRGQRLYEVSGQAIPLFYGAQPFYRHLAIGCSGSDVHELEDNLLALGFGGPAGLVADGSFTAADAAAVRAWQSSIGAPATGEVDLGALVMLPGAVRVAALHGAAGAGYAPGQPIVDVTDTSHAVTVSLDTTLAAGVKVGDAVTVQLPGAAPAAGKVIDVSGAAQVPASSGQGQGGPLRATLPVTIRLDDPAAGGALDQVPVRVSITDQVRQNVLAVPVSALVARSDGTFAVLVVRPSGRVPLAVRIGIFGDTGLVEVSGRGLAAGDLVEVPQPQ